MRPLFNHRHWAIKLTRPAIDGRKWSRLPELGRRRPALRLRATAVAHDDLYMDVVATLGYPVEDDSGLSSSCIVQMFDRAFTIHGVDPDQALALAEWFAVDQLSYRGYRIVERQRLIRFRPNRMKPYIPPPRPTASA